LDEAKQRNALKLPVRLMFQDEVRFGRISDPRKCWVSESLRPIVKLVLVWEYAYAYAAVSPTYGAIGWMLAAKIVVDGAPSHRFGQPIVPENMALVRLPPYSPELNPVEHLNFPQ